MPGLSLAAKAKQWPTNVLECNYFPFPIDILETMTMESQFPRLSDRHSEINKLYDVIVIGSGYGASIAASRCARAGQKVCVLERGKEWLPGDFPETLREASSHMQVTSQGKKGVVGKFCKIFHYLNSEKLTKIDLLVTMV